MRILLIASLSFALLAGMAYGLASREPAPPGPSPARQPCVAALGYVEGARPEVPLRPQATGTIAKIHVRRSGQVTAGELLVELESAVQQAQVALAQAEVERHEKDQELAGNEVNRARNASSRSADSVSGLELDRLRIGHQLAAKRLQEARARRRLAEAELAKTRIVAPFAGQVLEVNAEPGEMAGPGSTQPLLILGDLSRRRVLAYVDETDAMRVQLAQKAVVTVDGLAGREFIGRVSEVKARMGKRPVHSDAPDEYKDIWSRGVYVDLDDGGELLSNLRVKVKIRVP
jgi:RND family efflux transporter MFP subunit